MEKTKNTTARNRAVTTFLLALSAAFILAGCFNPLNPIDVPVQAGAGSLSVSIAGQGNGARTLYPNADFTKYGLTFASSEGTAYGPKTLTGKSAEVFTDIPAGTWTITAVGYVTINKKEYAAAEGNATATIGAGQSQSIDIPISAEQEGDNGYFSYNVTFPGSKVDAAALILRSLDPSYYYNDNGNVAAVDLKTSPAGYVDSEEAGSGLAPGYYRVEIRLENEYQRAGVSEIVHIYSNMETKAEYAYTEADFVDLVTLSGTANLDGAALSQGQLYVYERQPGGSSVNLGYATVSGGSWAISIPAVSESAEIYFEIYKNSWVNNIPGITLNPGDTGKSGIAIELITLSGAINATVNGVDPYAVGISAYPQGGGNSIGYTYVEPYSAGASWSMIVPAFSVETTVIFGVNFYNSSGSNIGSVSGISPTQVSNSAVSDIILNADYSSIILSGTIGAVTVDGVSPDGFSIQANNQNGAYLSSTWLNKSGAWSMSIPSTDTDLASTTSINFTVQAYIDGSYLNYDIPAAQSYGGKSISGIALGDVAITAITLSGTIGAVTVNGVKPEGFNIRALKEDGYRVSTSGIEGGEWSITLPTQDTQNGDEISIMLHANLDDSSTIKLLTTRTYNGGNITNIALGNVAFTTRTVSGTVANLPAGTEAAYVLAMSAVPESGILQEGRKYMLADVVIDGDNTWSLKVPSDSPASLWFVVQVYDGGTFRYFVTKSASGAAAAPLDINGMTKL